MFFINYCHGLLLSKYVLIVLICDITSLRGYSHPNEQPVVYMPQMLCPFAAH